MDQRSSGLTPCADHMHLDGAELGKPMDAIMMDEGFQPEHIYDVPTHPSTKCADADKPPTKIETDDGTFELVTVHKGPLAIYRMVAK